MVVRIKMKKMKSIFSIIIFTTLILASNSPNQEKQQRNDFIGTWELLEWTANFEEDENFPFGQNAYGRLSYDENGFMIAILMAENRPKFSSNDPINGTTEEIEAAFKTFFSYSGQYSINRNEKIVNHKVEACSNPTWIGDNQIREFQFKDNKLILTTPEIKSTMTNKKSARHKLIWMKM